MTEKSPFAIRLMVHRYDRQLSQSRLAEASGFDHSYICRLENGSRWPSREAVHHIADALALDPAERDELLASARFLPDDPTSAVAGVPELRDLYQLLAFSEERQALVRPMLAHLIALARSAA